MALSGWRPVTGDVFVLGNGFVVFAAVVAWLVTWSVLTWIKERDRRHK